MATLQAKSKWFIEERPFFKYFNSLESKADTTYRVFDHGDFFSVHGKDAVQGADIVFKSQSFVKNLQNSKAEISSLPTLNLSKLNFKSLARNLLLVLHYRLEIHQYNKDNWFLAFKASPGNLLEVQELLFDNVDLLSTSSSIIAVKIQNEGGQLHVGLGFVDSNTCVMKFAEFCDNDHFSNLESIILQLGPKECIVPKLDSGADAKKLKEIVKRSGVLLTERPRTNFNSKSLEQDLKRLVKTKKRNTGNETATNWCGDHVHASSCISASILYLALLSKEDLFGQFRVEKYDLSQYVVLDNAAIAALNLFSKTTTNSTQQGQPPDSIYALLNHCQTPQGQRLLSSWVKQPLVDVNLLEERLELVEAFAKSTQLRQSLTSDHLKKLPDFEKLSKRFHCQKAGLQDCYRTYQAIKQLPTMCDSLEICGDLSEQNERLIREVFRTPIQELYKSFEKFMEMLDTTLDFDMIQKHEFMVKSDFDPELERLRKKMNEIEHLMEKILNKAANDLDLEAGKSLKMELTSQYGHVFRVTCKEEKKLRSHKSFTTLDTNKAGVRFVNDRLRSLSSDYQESKEAYELQQNAVVKEIVAIASGYTEPLHILNDVIAKLDVLVSFAQAAVLAPITYVRPKLHPIGTGSNRIELVECRHPCVEVQDGVSFIPNDVVLEKEKHNFIVVTGPNMGGKSTYIRQAGVAVLMAQIGSFVPCKSAQITLVDAILARVGAGDCQVQGVSTFMAEMLETAAILRSATPNSLVIIDELGRGTSTYDGFGLAWAISHKIAVDIQAPCLFATHFDEMTALADQVESVVNYHVTALTDVSGPDGQSTLTMLYQVKPGSCDRSFGIHVATCVGFPDRVIEAAKRKAAELEDCYVTSGGLLDEESSRKRRKVKQRIDCFKEGEKIIREYIQAIREINREGLSDEEVEGKVKQLKSTVLNSNNQFISGMFDR